MFAVERQGAVVHLRMTRAESRNAITRDVWLALPEIIGEINGSSDLRLVVLSSSTPGIFCAGADIREFKETALDLEWTIENQYAVGDALRALAECTHPTLAAIDGPAFGAGAALAVACDFRIATVASTFSIPPAKLGIVYPQFATTSLVALIGERHAREMLLLAHTLDADSALASGLIDRIVPDLDAAIEEFATEFEALSPTSVRLLKKSIRRAVTDPTALADDLVRAAVESEDFQEGVHAFLEKRTPRFTGN